MSIIGNQGLPTLPTGVHIKLPSIPPRVAHVYREILFAPYVVHLTPQGYTPQGAQDFSKRLGPHATLWKSLADEAIVHTSYGQFLPIINFYMGPMQFLKPHRLVTTKKFHL